MSLTYESVFGLLIVRPLKGYIRRLRNCGDRQLGQRSPRLLSRGVRCRRGHACDQRLEQGEQARSVGVGRPETTLLSNHWEHRTNANSRDFLSTLSTNLLIVDEEPLIARQQCFEPLPAAPARLLGRHYCFTTAVRTLTLVSASHMTFGTCFLSRVCKA